MTTKFHGYTLHSGDRWELRASILRNLGKERDFFLHVFTGEVTEQETLQDPGYVPSRGYYLLARGMGVNLVPEKP